MHKLHDILCKHLLREALDPIGTVELEKPVAPLDEQRIDVYCELRAELPPPDALPYLGLLRRMAELEQRCLIEPFSTTPKVEQLDDNLRKKLNLQHGLRKAAKGTPTAKPVLWIVSPGRPEEALAGFGGSPVDGWPSGFYRCPPELTTWIVVLGELPKTAETLLLRLLGPTAMQLEALRELDGLTLDRAQRQPWIDLLADVRYLFDDEPELNSEEQTIMTELRQRWEREKADLRAEGRVEGRAAGRVAGRAAGRVEGKVEGRAESILMLLSARGLPVSEPVKARVLGCQDLRLLEEWLVRAATAASDTDVFAA